MSDETPGKLLHAIPNEDGNCYTYLVLPDLRKLRLPLHYSADEFALPGNMQIHVDGKVFALFDDSTRTGAILDSIGKIHYWTIIQPTTRGEFFEHQVPSFLDSVS